MARRDLKIYVSADTRGTVRATTAASKGFSKLQGAAVAAGGAMAAGLAVGAKKAFDEFRDAEKVTNQTNAALKSTHGVAKVTAKEIGILAEKISLKAGMDDEAIQSGQNLLLTFTKIRNEVGRGNDIFNRASSIIVDMSVALDQDLKSSAIQVGKALNDPVKGMTALQRVGVSFSQQQKDRVAQWVEEGKVLKAQRFILKELTTEFGGSAAAQADASDKLKVAWDNLFETIGRKFGPFVLKAMNKAARFIRQMELGRGAGGRFADKLGDVADAAKDVGEAIGPPLKAIGAFALKHPKVAAMATALGAFAVAYGKLRGGPGTGKLGSLGSAIGAMKPVPVFVTNAGGLGVPTKGTPTPVPTGKPGALGKAGRVLRWVPIIGSRGNAIGLALTAVALAASEHVLPDNNVGRREGQRRATQTPSGGRPAIPGSGGLSERLAAQEKARLDQLERSKRAHADWAASVKKRIGDVTATQKKYVADSRQAFHAAGERLQDLREKTATETGRIRKRFGDDTARGRDALRENYRQAAAAAKRQMDRTGVVTKEGLAFIRRLFVAELQTYGISRKDARQAVGQGGTRNDTFYLLGHQTGGLVRRAMGGMMVPGAGSGDKVHMQAMVEPGEEVFVLNRNASSALRQLEQLNAAVPRFQAGGGLKPGISRLVQTVLRKFPGLSVTSGLRAGDSGSFHSQGLAADLASGNYQYMNQAAAWIRSRFGRSLLEGIHNPNLSIDSGREVSPSFWGSATWAGHANHIHLAVQGALRRLVAKIRRVRVGGPDSPLKTIAQRGLDKVRGAANKRLSRISAPDAGFTGNLGHFGKGRLMNLWTSAGGDPSISNLMAAIALAESGGNPQAYNPSGASGLWQILGAILPGNLFNPMVNARNAVAKYRSQGLGAWVAYTSGTYRKFLQRGGRLKKGGRPRRGTIRRLGRPSRGRSLYGWRGRRDWTTFAGPKVRRGADTLKQGPMTSFDEAIAFGAAMAALTDDQNVDDIALADRAVVGYQSVLDEALARGDFVGATAAATSLKQWRDTLASLKGASEAQVDLAQQIKELKASIDAQTTYFRSVEGVATKTAIRALSDVISGQIGGYAGQRARSAGDGATGAIY